ncbi:hypothetical protein GN156_12585 [bacterium LRH843]|nr:hypothetical protein [bacterium LRH843]
MIDLLLVIFFLSLIALAVGIYKPGNMRLSTRRSVVKVIGPVVGILYILVLVVI